jgi:hypothetical protein
MPLPPAEARKRKTNRQAILRELRDMQLVLYGDVMGGETPAQTRALCARAYEVLEERRRIIRMKPKPRDAEVSLNPRPRKRLGDVPFSDPSVS